MCGFSNLDILWDLAERGLVLRLRCFHLSMRHDESSVIRYYGDADEIAQELCLPSLLKMAIEIFVQIDY